MDRHAIRAALEVDVKGNGIVCLNHGLRAFQFPEPILDKLPEYLVRMFSGVCDLRAKTAIVDVLHADFAVKEMFGIQFKPHPQLLPNLRVTRTDDKKATDTDILYQAWEPGAFIT